MPTVCVDAAPPLCLEAGDRDRLLHRLATHRSALVKLEALPALWAMDADEAAGMRLEKEYLNRDMPGRD